jgi:hypothetical protein
MPKRDKEETMPVNLSQEESQLFYEKLRRHMMARKRLDEINEESKALRTFLQGNGDEIASFIEVKRLKSCRAEGANLRTITKTIKVKPTADQVFEAIAEMYGNPEMVDQVKTHVTDKYVTPKLRTKTVLKIVKLRPKKAKQPAAAAPAQ